MPSLVCMLLGHSNSCDTPCLGVPVLGRGAWLLALPPDAPLLHPPCWLHPLLNSHAHTTLPHANRKPPLFNFHAPAAPAPLASHALHLGLELETRYVDAPRNEHPDPCTARQAEAACMVYVCLLSSPISVQFNLLLLSPMCNPTDRGLASRRGVRRALLPLCLSTCDDPFLCSRILNLSGSTSPSSFSYTPSLAATLD